MFSSCMLCDMFVILVQNVVIQYGLKILQFRFKKLPIFRELSHQQDICLEDAALAYQEQYFLMLFQSVSSYPDGKFDLS